MSKIVKLKCTANAHVEGQVVKAGEVAEYESTLAKRLLASSRFVVFNEEEEEEEAKEPSTVAEYKAALDELGVEYEDDAKKADLVALYESAIAE